jgi:drug/metabolite transporter (DMT)-like permease
MATSKHLAQIHAAVFLFGLAGLFGKLVALPAAIIVLGRVFFGAISLYVLLKWMGRRLRLESGRAYGMLAVLGVILAIHWLTFFQSIQVSTVAVGLLTYSAFPVFTAFLEPVFFKERLASRDVVLALITFAGVALVIPEFKLENKVTQGVLWGIASGLAFAFLAILNRKYVRTYSSLALAYYQDLAATVVLLPFLFILQPVFTTESIALLVLLGVVFTAFSHSLFIDGLKSVPAKTASIIASLEPVYGIAAAALLLHEFPEWRVLLGGGIILAATAYVTLVPAKGA